MKVNFNGSYKDIQRLISVVSKPSAETAGFGDLLSSISPDKPQPVENTDNIFTDKVLSPLHTEIQESPMARLNLDLPEMSSPDFEPIQVPKEIAAQGTQIVNEAPKSVKSPTILSARRLHTEDPFEGLSQKEKIGKVRQLAEVAGQKHGIDPALSLAVVETESGFNPVAISKDGFASKGLMQLLDSTGREQLAKSGSDKPYQPFDPRLNIDLGVGYLRYLHDIFNQSRVLPNNLSTVPAANSSSLEKLAVAAYNAGEGRVASAQERAIKDGKNPGLYEQVESYLPESTQEYVRKVMLSRSDYEQGNIG